jgi:hypothetical protein
MIRTPISAGICHGILITYLEACMRYQDSSRQRSIIFAYISTYLISILRISATLLHSGSRWCIQCTLWHLAAVPEDLVLYSGCRYVGLKRYPVTGQYRADDKTYSLFIYFWEQFLETWYWLRNLGQHGNAQILWWSNVLELTTWCFWLQGSIISEESQDQISPGTFKVRIPKKVYPMKVKYQYITRIRASCLL